MNDLDTILDECLDALLAGEWTLDDCLDTYPDYAAELKPALQIALLTSHLKSPELPAAQVAALEMRFREAAPIRTSARIFPFVASPLGRMVATVALALILTLGVGGGAVAASANSLPGDWLYGLKRLWEAIILALASLNNSQDDVWLHLAETRLDEAVSLGSTILLDENVFTDVYEATAEAMMLADADTRPRVIAFLRDVEVRVNGLATTAAGETIRQDLLLLVMPDAINGYRLPASIQPPSKQNPPVEPSPSETATPTVSPTPITPSPTLSATPSVTPSPTLTPTSRVPATATETRTPLPSATPLPPSRTPSLTPTATWTRIAPPQIPTQGQPGPTQDNSNPPRPSSTPASVDSSATLRYRDTQAAVYATQTAQVAQQTEEVEP